MSSIFIKWIANRLLKDNQLNKFGVEDPYYEYIEVGQSRNGLPKYTKVIRRTPEGISAHDKLVLESVKLQAYRYDMWFSALGMRFGLSNVVGLVPVLGSLVTTFWSLSILMNSRSIDGGLPLDIQLLFLFNIAVDFFLSLLPIVGDLIEMGYKANLRNFLLLEKHLVRVGQKNEGIISADEVRPGFINDKVQPFVDHTLIPGAAKAGKQIKKLVNSNSHHVSSAKSGDTVGSKLSIQSSRANARATLKPFDVNRSIESLNEVDEKSD